MIDNNTKKILIISWSFYPSQTIGAHRPGKFCKYLPAFGWTPVVLTVKEKYYQNVDQELINELPSDVLIERTTCLSEAGLRTAIKKLIFTCYRLFKTQRPANLSEITLQTNLARKVWFEIPENGWWFLTGLRKGLKLARECDVIWSTSPTPGSLLLAAMVSRSSGKPLMIDLRDPWQLENHSVFPTRFHDYLNSYVERWVFKAATSVIVVTKRMARNYEEKYSFLKGRIHVVYNGYDSEDFKHVIPARKHDGFIKIGYFGSIGGGRETSFEYLLKQLLGLRQTFPLFKKIRIVLRGPRMSLIKKMVDQVQANDFVEIGDSINYGQTLKLMSEMDYLLLLGTSEHEYALPGKLFEYIGAGKPVLAITPPGELTDFVIENNIGVVINPQLDTQVSQLMKNMLENQTCYERQVQLLSDRFTRKKMTEEIVNLLNKIISVANLETATI